MIITKKDCSIEGKKIGFQCRKFYIGRPYRHPVIKKRVFAGKMTIFGKAYIEKERNPKKFIYYKQSNLDKDDEIRGETVTIVSTKVIPTPSISKATASHSASFSYAKGDTIATIVIPTRAEAEKKR